MIKKGMENDRDEFGKLFNPENLCFPNLAARSVVRFTNLGITDTRVHFKVLFRPYESLQESNRMQCHQKDRQLNLTHEQFRYIYIFAESVSQKGKIKLSKNG